VNKKGQRNNFVVITLQFELTQTEERGVIVEEREGVGERKGH